MNAPSSPGGGTSTGGKKILYIRQHSDHVRRYNPAKNHMDDDPIVKNGAGFGLKSNMVKLMCRKKQRLLTQAWEKWIEQTKVVHDYAIDARIILSRARADDELLDELEIEVLHKWVIQYKEEDPTGLSALLTSCRSKSAKIQALQSLRLEQFEPGELILCQNTLPRADDGLFTILNGSCDVLQFPEGSMALLNLGTYFKNRDWDAAKEVLNTARLINTMHAPTGFGELASLALIKRTASVRASPGQSILTELLVIPRRCLYAVLQASTLIGTDVHSTSEAIDFLRQSGLAMSSSSRELFRIACSMRKKVFNRGKVLYEKNEVGTCCYIIVSGEIIADTQYCPGEAEYADDDYPYICSLPSNCFILSNGSLLGDEAFLGVTNAYSSNEGGKYQSTASVISEVAVVFQIAGVGLDFLLEKLNSVRYSALAYMNISPWSVPITQADSNSVYTMFNSLRKCVSESNPYRGIHHSLVVQRPMKLSELGLQHHHHHHHRHHLTDGSVSTVSHHKFGSVAHGHHASGHNRFEIPHDHHSHSHQQSGGGSLATSTGGGLGGDDSTFEDEVDTLPVLPNPVIQHALRIKRDLKNAEAVRIRAIAKDGILHDELKRRGEQSSEKSYMSIRLSAAQRMLEYNIAAYKDRCDGTNPVPPALIDDDDVSEMSSAAHKSQKPAAESNYGVDFAIDADDDLLDTGSDGSEWSDEVPLGAVDIEEERRSKLQKATAHLCSTGILQHHAHVAYNKRRQEEKKTEVAALALQAVSSNFMQSNINKRNGRNTSMPGSLTASIGGSVVGSSNNSVSGSLTEANVRKHIQTARNLASGAQTGGTKAKEGASNANEKGKPNIKSQFFIRRRIPLRYALTHEMDLNAPSNNTTGTLQIQRQASGQLLVELDRAVLDKEKTARAKVRRPEASPIDIESPREFMRMIRSKEFPNRRTKYTAEKEWSTRFVKTTDASHGTSHLVPLNVGGSDGLGNDLQDGAPARNRTVLYWEQMRGKKKGKGGKENEEGRSKPQSQSKTLSASVTFGGVNSGSVVPGAAGGAEADVEAERSRAGSLDEADLGHIIAASTEISRMNTTDMDGEGQGAIKEPKVIGHVRFQDDQTVGTPPRVVTPRERPKSGEVVSAKEVEGVAVATGTGSVSSSTVPIPAPVDVSTDAGAGSLSTTPVRSKGSETPTTPGGSTATASSTPTAAARKSGVDEHGNRLSLAQLNPGADALERLRAVQCTQKPSSRYLDGKRKQAGNSKFRLILPADEDPYLVTARRQFSLAAGASSTYSTFGPSTQSPSSALSQSLSNPGGGLGNLGTASAAKPNNNNPFIGRNKSKIAKSTLALFSCLQDPANVNVFSHPTMDQVVAGNASKPGVSVPVSLKRGQSSDKLDKLADQFLDTSSGPKMTLRDGCLALHRDEVLADWQHFCVDTVTNTKISAQKSMPILGRVVNKVGGDVKGVEVRGSSKGGKLVGTQGIREYGVKGPSSYLELHTAKQQNTHSYKQQHHHK